MDRLARIAAFAACLTLTGACAQGPAAQSDATHRSDRGYEGRADVESWLPDAAQRTGVPVERIRSVLREARYSSAVARAILPTSSSVQRSWRAYRTRFLEPVRLDAGQRFWDANADALDRAQALYGIPPEIVVAIVGVETLYGKYPGDYRAIDVFATLGFDWPSQAPRDRSAFFRGELEELLIFSREQNVDPASVRGSYAGAVGLPQFMPSSLRRYAIDFDGDGVIDVRTSAPDAIGSVANFLVAHGWSRDAPIWFDATVAAGSDPKPLVANDLTVASTREALGAAGIACDVPETIDTRLGLIDLETPDEPTIWKCAAPNFFAITRYNHSFFYAAAVVEVAAALRAARPAPRSAP